MLVKAKKTFIGAEGYVRVGDVIEVQDQRAKDLKQNGLVDDAPVGAKASPAASNKKGPPLSNKAAKYMANTPQIISDEITLAHLHADAGPESDLIALYISAATQQAVDFLGRNVYATDADMAAAVLAKTADDDPIVANDSIRAAILLILGKLYAYREDVVVGSAATVVELPFGARQMLFPYRVGLGV